MALRLCQYAVLTAIVPCPEGPGNVVHDCTVHETEAERGSTSASETVTSCTFPERSGRGKMVVETG